MQFYHSLRLHPFCFFILLLHLCTRTSSPLLLNPTRKQRNLIWAEKFFLFIRAEPLDSDGDGFSNIAEIPVRTFPGDPKFYKWTADFDKDIKIDITVYRSNIEGSMSTLFWYCGLRHELGSNPSGLPIDSLL